jgi:putative Mg2+ transporter-C (MgtC) family protein
MWNYLVSDLQPEVLVRVALTLLTGFILGFERERHGRAAGLRTTLLVSLSACVVMVISEFFYRQSLVVTGSASSWHPDPARLAAGALSGMGFLGAGVIIHAGGHIRGVTTAATLWFATVMGLAFGAGLIGLGLLASAVAFVVLHLLPSVEAHMQDDAYSDFSVRLDVGAATLDLILNELKSCAIKVESMDIQTDRQPPVQRVVFHLKYRKTDLVRFPREVTQRVGELPGVQETHWHA